MDVDEILKKYGKKIEQQVNTEGGTSVNENFSRVEFQFYKDSAPEFSIYENWCIRLCGFIKIKLA